MKQLFPEWAPCEAVILAWPDKHTDWAPWLESVQSTYEELTTALLHCDITVIILCRDAQISALQTRFCAHRNILLVKADYNDTWARDYAFLTRQTQQGPQPVEFVFNGWGQKFNASKDNLVNRAVLSAMCQLPLESFDVIAEGGALEIDHHGTLLSTSMCLFNPKRNGNYSHADYQEVFEKSLGCSRFVVLEHGHLQGDDTDGHIDTLVRFTPNDGLVVQGCINRLDDIHAQSLSALVDECTRHFPHHHLYVLPLPEIYNNQGERLPASYANYLICNNRILVPTYNATEDEQALNTIASAYPDYLVEPINCYWLVQQFGSLHCITMQVPRHTFKPDVLAQAKTGVAVHAQ